METGTEATSAADRRIAALAHLGVPLYGLFLPLVIWAVSASVPFRRAHARQAFSFQCAFFVLWVVAVGLTIFGVLSAVVLIAILVVVFMVEIPQVLRALSGQLPVKVVPIDILPI